MPKISDILVEDATMAVKLPRDLAASVQSPSKVTTVESRPPDRIASSEQETLARSLDLEYIKDLRSLKPSALFVERIPIGHARRHGVMGFAPLPPPPADLGEADNEQPMTVVAFSDIASLEQLDVLSRFLGKPLRPILAPAQAIAAAINAAYQQRTGQAQAFIERLEEKDLPEAMVSSLTKPGEVASSGNQREDLLDIASRAPVIKLVNLMLFEAVKQSASDVHVQPYEDRIVVRLRIDGVLFDTFDLPRAMLDEVVSRIKVMGKMNIAEKRVPQDGRTTVQVGDSVIDLRISALPTSFGERIVIRLLDKSARLYRLAELGMDGVTLERFRKMIQIEHGLILVTGPTGSGKSTTLYAALQEVSGKELNIITLEDPIEYQLPGVSQTQVSDKKGMTFASGLRSVLRQDPDIIMVGEIRDRETAVMAIQSALTGHLVFSTLHTNDASSAMTRLLDLGIEPYLAASSVVGVLAQRLVRRVCPQCAQAYEASDDELRRFRQGETDERPVSFPSNARSEMNAGPGHLQRGAGCAACRRTGYRGRVGIFELLTVNDAIGRCITERATAASVKTAAIAAGMRTLRDDGMTKAIAGHTTLEEIERITMRATV